MPDADPFDESAEHGPAGSGGPPPPLLTAAALTGVQGVVTLLVAVADALSLSGDRLMLGISVAVFFAAYGGALVACAIGIYRLRPWARGPVLLAQLIWLGVAWSYRDAGVLAVVLAVSAVVVLAGLLTPASVDALDRPEHRSPD